MGSAEPIEPMLMPPQKSQDFFLSLIHCLGASVRVVIVVIFLWQAVHPSNVGIFGKESFQT